MSWKQSNCYHREDKAGNSPVEGPHQLSPGLLGHQLVDEKRLFVLEVILKQDTRKGFKLNQTQPSSVVSLLSMGPPGEPI